MSQPIKDLAFRNDREQVFAKILTRLNGFTTQEIDEVVNSSVNEINSVDHPDHYGGDQNPYEAIKVIEAWQLGFNLGNTIKYVCRAGKKNPTKVLEDLKKAQWYLEREISRLESL